MKKLIFLLFTVLLFEKYANTQTSKVGKVIESKLKKIIAPTESSYLSKYQLDCRKVKTQGDSAYCPSGYLPTSCACGKHCTWNILLNTGCHCQCDNVNWTSVWCCTIP